MRTGIPRNSFRSRWRGGRLIHHFGRGSFSASPRRHLIGRLIVPSPDRIVVEFDVSGPALIWQPDASVTVVLKVPGEVQASVVPDVTTAPGRIETGQTVRLVVRLDHPLAHAADPDGLSTTARAVLARIARS